MHGFQSLPPEADSRAITVPDPRKFYVPAIMKNVLCMHKHTSRGAPWDLDVVSRDEPAKLNFGVKFAFTTADSPMVAPK